MGRRTKCRIERGAGVLALACVIGFTLLAGLPAAAPAAVEAGPAASGVQAFSDRAAVDRSDRVAVEPTGLGLDAIAMHALIEYVLAPPRSAAQPAPDAGPDEAGRSVQAVAAAAPAATQTTPTPTSVVPTPPTPTAVVPAQPAPAVPSPTAVPVVPTPVPAQPTPVVPTPVPPPPVANEASRGQAALARIPVSPGSVGFTIEFLPGRSGYGGLTYPDSRRIEIYVDAGWSDGYLAHVVAHEIGHAVDMARNSRSDHERWRAARGIPQTTKWWADPYTSDFATPGGDFAECFAAWAVGTSATRSEFGSCAGTAGLMSELVWG